jgi:putative membrane protein
MSLQERTQWLSRQPNEPLAKKLRVVAWALTSVVLLLVGLMRRPEMHINLPEGWSLSFLPAVHAALNSAVALSLVIAVVAIRKGKVGLHQKAMMLAMFLSILFLLCYVAYHFTTAETRYGGTGWMKAVYLFLLITHITLAALSLPAVLFTFIAAWTNRFAAHRRLARWVFPVWLYVAVTGPICYFMLRPFYT